MGRVAWRIRAAAALTLLAVALPAYGAGPRGGAPEKRAASGTARAKGAYDLDAVKIFGSAEHPGVLFFLPRAKFRLLPFRSERDWRRQLLTDDTIMGEAPE